jgi:hypothetical protein
MGATHNTVQRAARTHIAAEVAGSVLNDSRVQRATMLAVTCTVPRTGLCCTPFDTKLFTVCARLRRGRIMLRFPQSVLQYL